MTHDEAALFESLERERQRALLDMQDGGEIPGGDPRILSHEAKEHALLRGDAHAIVHALRGRAERVVERPELAQKGECGGKSRLVSEHGSRIGKSRPSR